jgi:FkbM family methyltransferase
VGNNAGELALNVSPTLGWSTAVARTHHKNLRPIKHKNLRPIKVESVRIDDMASAGTFRRPVRFIKIEVEGFECSVLDGMSRQMREDSPLVLVEVNRLMLRPNGHTVPDLLRRLSNHGQRLFVVS